MSRRPYPCRAGPRWAAPTLGVLVGVLTICLLAGCAGGSTATADPASARTPGPRRTVSVPQQLSTFRSSHELVEVPAPVHLDIAAIGVHSRLERLGQRPDRTVAVPVHWQRAGWYADGPAPGAPGAAVILGHVDSPTGPAVFAGLSRLRRGDEVVVRRADGTTVTFTVDHLEQHARREFPAVDVYWPTLRPELRLITCGGQYVRRAGGYQANVIVFAVAATNARPGATVGRGRSHGS
ncbi:MAG: class F sortase [Actinomycetes bacterium]